MALTAQAADLHAQDHAGRALAAGDVFDVEVTLVAGAPPRSDQGVGDLQVRGGGAGRAPAKLEGIVATSEALSPAQAPSLWNRALAGEARKLTSALSRGPPYCAMSM